MDSLVLDLLCNASNILFVVRVNLGVGLLFLLLGKQLFQFFVSIKSRTVLFIVLILQQVQDALVALMQFGLENKVVLEMGRDLVLFDQFLAVVDLAVEGYLFVGRHAFAGTGGWLGGAVNQG